jgi:hypothetical protein
MSNKSKVSQEKKAKIMAFLNQELATKGNVRNTAIETIKSGLAGVAGAAIGSWIGRPSLYMSIPALAAGKYMDSNLVSAASIGMMAGGLFKNGSVNGTELDGLDGANERLKAFGRDLKYRLYIDKIKSIVGAKKKESTTNGLGNTSYFNAQTAIDMGGLESIESQIKNHAEAFERRQFEGNGDDYADEQQAIIY